MLDRRCVADGCSQYTVDKDQTYTGTPPLISLKLLLLVDLPRRYSLIFYDASPAFLNAYLKEEVYTSPPADSCPDRMAAACGNSATGMYGLKAAPKVWQLRFA